VALFFRPKSEVSAFILTFTLITTGCTVGAADPVPQNSTCRNLSYADAGPSRGTYLPCAGEMLQALETLDSLTVPVLNGEAGKRAEGRGELRRIIALMQAAGGMKILERWEDQQLTHLNVDIHNAVVHYQTFYMLPIRKPPHPFAEKTREAAAAEALRGAQNYRSARMAYQQLGGR
jgi:hypothetical protein